MWPTWRVLVRVVIVSVATTISTGCARRYKVTPEGLAQLERRAGSQDKVFVYPHNRLISVYQLDLEKIYKPGQTVKIDVERQIDRVVLKRSSPGQIIAKGDQNGVPILWVSFDPECNDPSCSFGFVRTEDDLYKLAVVPPPRDGYKPAEVYRRSETKRNRMKRRKVKALGEANEVYTVKRKWRVLTIRLDVKKRIREREKTNTKVLKGRPER